MKRFVLLVVFVSSGALWAQPSSGHSPPDAEIADTRSEGVGIEQRLGEQVPLALTFTDENGQPLTLAQAINKTKPTAASKVQSYLNSAQRTIKQPTTSEVKLNQDGSRSIHFVRTVPENGHVYTMRAIVYVSTTGEVRLATYGKPY